MFNLFYFVFSLICTTSDFVEGGSRSKIKRKTSFPFVFCSLIRTFAYKFPKLKKNYDCKANH